MKTGGAQILTLLNISAIGFSFIFGNLACATDDVAPSNPLQTSPSLISPSISPKIVVPSSVSATKKIVSKPAEKPLWNELTPAQKLVLSPLAPEWNKLEKLRKAKWLEIAEKFQAMKPEEQQRMHDRMREWAKLTPEQRRLARENFSRANKIDRAKKSVQWQQYQQLSEEQKKQLAARAVRKKQLANLPSTTQSKQKTVTPIKSKTSPAILKQVEINQTTPQTIQQTTQPTTTVLPDLHSTEK